MSNRTRTRTGKLHPENADGRGAGPGPSDAHAPPPDGVEDRLRALFYALINYFRKKVDASYSVAELHHLVLGVLRDMNVGETNFGWGEAEPATIPDCKRQANLHRPLRVPASVAEIHDPELVSVHEAGGKVLEVEAVTARFIDRAGNSIWSLDITGPDLIDRVQERFKRGGPVELLGIPVALPTAIDRRRVAESLRSERRSFYLHLADIRASTSTLDLLGASAAERASTESLLGLLARKRIAPVAYLWRSMTENLKVVGLDKFPLLDTLIHFTVLQALSSGRIDHAPARLHGMVVGPPGQGKKLIGLAARVLNPISEEVSPTKVSPAGLVGASSQCEGRWVSQPGVLPRGTGGVTLLQDAHGWNRSVVNRVAPILQEVMEDGVARDAVSGGIVREAQTALLLDLNRTSQVRPSGAAVSPSMEAAILQVRPVLSRMDLLCEIPEDVERAWTVARQMYAPMKTSHVPLDEQPWVREARLLVAALRDRHPEIELDPVRHLMEQKHEEIHKANADLFKARPELGDIPTRMAISFGKLVSASARSRASSVASTFDVDVATSFITMKLKFLSMRPGLVVPPSGSNAEGPAAWVANFKGQEVETSEVKRAYEQATGRSADERTFRRALLKLGATRLTKGRYLLPP